MLTTIIPEDAEEVALLYNDCFSDKWNIQSFENMLNDKAFFGYKVTSSNKINGFILCRQVLDEIEIITFCVSDLFRNQGVGSELLHKVSEYAKASSATVFLEVAENNPTAIHLYKKEGYEQISERKKYYNETTALIMKLSPTKID